MGPTDRRPPLYPPADFDSAHSDASADPALPSGGDSAFGLIGLTTMRRAHKGGGSASSDGGGSADGGVSGANGTNSVAANGDSWTGPLADTDALNYGKKYRVLFPQRPSQGNLLGDDAAEAAQFLRRRAVKARNKYGSYNWRQWLAVCLPCMRWLPTYDYRRNLLMDILAGASVGAMVVPQGMSYANLAGVPAVYGLYGAFVPCIVYSLLGSSRQLAVGPVAVTSLLLSSGIPDIVGFPAEVNPNRPVHPANQDRYNRTAIQVAFVAGLLYTAVGLLRLGFLVNFLSHSLIAGFTTGASVIIGLSQVKYLMGYNVPRRDPVHEQIHELIKGIHKFKWQEFLMGIIWIALLLFFKETGKRSKRFYWMRAIGPLTVTVLSIGIVNAAGWEKTFKVVGKVPAGLPSTTIGWWSPIPDFGKVVGLAVVICMIDILESMSIARALATKNGYEIEATQELRGLGVANLFGAAFNAYTTTGSFSRSAVADSTGARSQITSFTTGIVVMVVLLVATPLFTNMPQNAQGAIVISAVIGLFNYSEAFFLWRVNKFDFLVFLTAALAVMFLGVEIGLAVAIALSLVIVLWKTAFPHTAVLGQLPGTNMYRNVKQYPESKQLPGMLLVRIDAPIYFANINPIRDALKKYEHRAAEEEAVRGGRLHFLLVDLSPVTDIDASAVHWLKDWIKALRERGIQVVLANPSRQVVRLMMNASLPQLIGEEFICVRMHDAVTLCKEIMEARALMQAESAGGASAVAVADS